MIDLAAIRRAAERLAEHGLASPIERSPALSGAARSDVYLKLECRQPTGSFKLRGAANFMARMPPEARRRGVVCSSTGNHGRAVARAAGATATAATICLSRRVPENKVAAIRAEPGARVRIVGDDQEEAQQEVDRLASAEGMVEVPPFDHPDIIAGQGTAGLELIEALPELDLILVPLSGGGLAAGVALAAKAVRPQVRVVGVSMVRGAAMAASIRAGWIAPVREHPSLADALGGGLGANRWTYPLCRDLLDGTALVSESEIRRGIRTLWTEGVVAEGGGAVGAAALLAGRVEARGSVAVVVSGGNIDEAVLAAIAARRTVQLGEGEEAVEIPPPRD